MSNEKQEELFSRLVEERAHEFVDIKDNIDLNKLVYKFKTGVNEPKDFTNYQIPWKLSEDLREGDINPKEVLKNQARFKLDLSEIKTGGKKLPHQKDIIKNITTFFDLWEQIIDFFKDFSFLLFEVKYKSKYGEELEILTPKQMLQRLPIATAHVKTGNTRKIY